MSKIALITGATSGIGKATAEAFADLGINLILCGRRLDRLYEVQEALSKKVKVNILAFDVRNRSEVEKANAERDEKYLGMSVITEPQIARQLIIDGVYSVIDEKHIKELETMVTANDDDNTNT